MASRNESDIISGIIVIFVLMVFGFFSIGFTFSESDLTLIISNLIYFLVIISILIALLRGAERMFR